MRLFGQPSLTPTLAEPAGAWARLIVSMASIIFAAPPMHCADAEEFDIN